ncbi:MAG: leucine-rich repeat domain-containing protein [Bacteroidales bacterium]|nr:leucine-rich repeat domain-containing protein [Bacteroidales bacterium]
MKRTVLFSVLALALAMCGQRAFAYDFTVDGIHYTKLPHQLPGGGCGETTLMVVDADHENSYSGDIVIPETVTFGDTTFRVTNIGNEAFYNCTDLTSITLPNNLENIGFHGISGCPKLIVIYIPAGMTQINSFAFADNANLDYIFVNDAQPFYLWYGAFNDINDHCKIVVPCGCLPAFEADPDWASLPLMDDCGNVGIGEAETAAVNVYPNPSTENFTVECEGMTEALIYSMDGKLVKQIACEGQCRIEGLSEGVYLLKITTENGKILSSKIMRF